MTPQFEFQPFPNRLYRAEDLLGPFDPDHPESYVEMPDFRIYREFIASGGAATGDYLTAMTRALHDNGITQHLADTVAAARVVGIAGGHGVARGTKDFAQAANLAAALTREGFMVASGGGPGIMEAVHLGAMLSAEARKLRGALKTLGQVQAIREIPKDAKGVVSPHGDVNQDVATSLGKYLAPAVRLRKEAGFGGGLGIPTWLYGQEPFTPFADSIAKYFQNSIREDGLLALATHGVIYFPGSAGTLQEVFQDAAQNFYHTFPMGQDVQGEFSPMIFLGSFWTKQMPVKRLLKALFANSTVPPAIVKEFERWVMFTDDAEKAVSFLGDFKGSTPSTALRRVLMSRSNGSGRRVG